MLALADLLREERPARRRRADALNPMAPRVAHLPGEGQVGHLAVHGRRAERGGPVRSQAGADQTRRPADRHRRLQRQSRAADEVAVQLPAIWPVGRLGLREVPERRAARGRFRVHQVALQRVERPRAGAVPDQHRHPAARVSRARARGSLMAWGARTRTCPATSCWETTRG